VAGNETNDPSDLAILRIPEFALSFVWLRANDKLIPLAGDRLPRDIEPLQLYDAKRIGEALRAPAADRLARTSAARKRKRNRPPVA
jgi:hypothetical protein